jgi:nicotinate phosphoribosyltransferase
VLSFRAELEAFTAFLRCFPDNGVLLVDTYDVEQGVRTAIAAARETGTSLRGVRIDSGDLEALSRRARELLDQAGQSDAQIVVSGDLEEVRIAELVASRAPIDLFGVGTDLGTSRDSPTVNGVYKLVADADPAGGWRGVRKLSAEKETLPGPKQVFRRTDGGRFAGDLIASEGERCEGERLLVPVMQDGEIVLSESLETMRGRAEASLRSLPPELRRTGPGGAAPYPVEISERLAAAE